MFIGTVYNSYLKPNPLYTNIYIYIVVEQNNANTCKFQTDLFSYGFLIAVLP